MTISQGSKPRDVSLDIARGIAMLLVIYEHSLEMFIPDSAWTPALAAFDQWQVISSFRMPLFFIVSGFLFRAKPFRDVVRHALSLLFTAYIVHALCWCLTVALQGQKPWLGGLVMPFYKLGGFYSVTVWFLAALALIQLCYHALTKLTGWRRYFLGGVIVSGFLIAQARDTNIFQLSALLPGLLFYGFGRWARDAGITARSFYRHWTVPVFFFALTVLLAPVNGGCGLSFSTECANKAADFGVLIVDGDYGYFALFIVTALTGSLAILWFSEIIARRTARIRDFLSWMGRHTLSLLLINGFFIWFVNPALAPWLPMDSEIVATLTAIAGVAVHALLLKPLHPVANGANRLANAAASWVCGLFMAKQKT